MDKMLTSKIDQPWDLSDSIYSDLILSKNLIYDPCNFKCSKLVLETESIEYGACSFSLDLANIKFRIAKITPTKIGQFVTFWKRTGNGPIQPYDTTDKIDFFVVVTRKDDNFGQFVFPYSALYKYGIISKNGQGGKRAIRVYPPWDKTTNPQAKRTQAWQSQFFLEVLKDRVIDHNRTRLLYNIQE